MSEHHFVIKYNSTTKEWEWDYDTEVSSFDGKAIFLEDKGEWVSSAHTDELSALDSELCDKLGYAIFGLNNLEKVD